MFFKTASRIDSQTRTKDRLYGISNKLYTLKDSLEHYLSRKTNELFDLEDKIILYDLTNTYFEGEKRNSRKARRGRSKEKRSDCPLLVLALVVNVEGFIKYSTIYEGHRSDSSEANLALIAEKGYDYVCVSRSNLKKYSCIKGQSRSV
jgi:hypothetical protein